MTPSKSSRSLAAWAGLAALSLAACGLTQESPEASTATSRAPFTSSAEPTPADDLPTSFDAGEYEAQGEYPTPAGTQSIGVNLDLDAAGTIMTVTVEPQAERGNSVQFQKKFAQGIAKKVVGRPITELSVDKVSGSSLTSKGFNQAITTIITEARA